MNAYVDIGGSEVLSLKGALLVYRGRSRGFVTWHEVRNEKSEGAPFLGEAQEVTTDFVRHLAEGLGTAIPMEILPENVLARTAETIAWWTPAIVRIMFFAAHDAEAYRLSGRRFCQPPLVWRVTGRELVDLRAISIEERNSVFTPYGFFIDFRDPKDGELGFYEFVQVEHGRIIQGIVYTTAHNARHVCRDRHAFTIHYHTRLYLVGCLLQFLARLALGIEYNRQA